ncbi:MAG: hypothetical protein U0X39_03125 [Bacteroidales bacterium]
MLREQHGYQTQPSEKIKQFKGYVTSDDRGTGRFIDPLPLETGHTFLMAPDDPERLVKITSPDADIMLFDSRSSCTKWLVCREESASCWQNRGK